MTRLESVLVPLDGSVTAARSLGCATWLASRLGARLHILSATSRELPAEDELRRLRVPEADWPIVHLHRAAAYPAGAILGAIEEHRADLVVMTAHGSAAEAATPGAPELGRSVGHVTEAVLERCRAPVLLLPTGYQEVLPWQRLLVAVSGGTESDSAIALAVHLAAALDLAVIVAHVSDGDVGDEELDPRTRYADELHHEYPGQLEELVSRAVPSQPADLRRCIRRIALERGQVAGGLLQVVRREGISALLLGWHGQLAKGRAETFKQLLSAIDVPIVLVRPGPEALFRLKVGEELG